MPASSEERFMADLLAGLDASAFDDAPSQSPPRAVPALRIKREPSPRCSSRAVPTQRIKLEAGSSGSVLAQSVKLEPVQRIELEPPDAPSCSRRALPPVKRELSLPSRREVLPTPSSSSPVQSRREMPIPPTRSSPPAMKRRGAGLLSSRQQVPQAAHPPLASARQYVRARVLAVLPGSYEPPCGPAPMVKAATVRRAAARRQVVLELEELGRHELVDGQRAKGAGHGTRRQVVLRDEWLATAELVHVGDVVNLIGTWAAGESAWEAKAAGDDDDADLWAEVDERVALPRMTVASSALAGEEHTTPADNLLILHPDVLLSATAISGTSTCTRKPLVQARLRSSAADDGGSTEALVMGAMLHAVLQACLTGQGLPVLDTPPLASAPECFPVEWAGLPPTNFARGFVEQQVHAHVAAHLEDLVGAGLETGRAAQQLMESAAPFGQFAQLYLAHPHGEIEVSAVKYSATAVR
jgi:DNA replication ATP-dependent helicase Dna2